MQKSQPIQSQQELQERKEELLHRIINFGIDDENGDYHVLGIGFVVEVNDKGEPFVKFIGDPSRLKKVLGNDCKNRKQYGIKGKTGVLIDSKFSYSVWDNSQVSFYNHYSITDDSEEDTVDCYQIENGAHEYDMATYIYSDKYKIGAWENGFGPKALGRALETFQIKASDEGKCKRQFFFYHD